MTNLKSKYYLHCFLFTSLIINFLKKSIQGMYKTKIIKIFKGKKF